MLLPAAEYPASETLKRLEHEYSLSEELDPAWAARPMAITRHRDRTVLVLEDPGGDRGAPSARIRNTAKEAQDQGRQRRGAVSVRGDQAR